MRVSLLVPIYGVEKYIAHCAESLFSQTYEELEYIFVNDCTKDRSLGVLLSVLDRYPHRRPHVRVIDHATNRGLAAARNTALEHATGEYVLHVDSDDYLAHNAVELLVDAAKREDADIVVFDLIQIFASKSVRTTDMVPSDKAAYIRRLFRRQASVGVCGKFIRRCLYMDNGVRAIEGLNFGEDYATTPRLAYLANKILKVDLPLYYYVRVNETSYTRAFADASIQDIWKAISALEAFFSNVPDAERYALALQDLKVYNEVALLKCGSTAQRIRIISLFKGCPAKWYRSLPIVDRLVILLAHSHLWLILDWYVRTGFAVKQFLR